MTYAWLCLAFAVPAAAAVALTWSRWRRRQRLALALTAVVLVVLTAVFDNVMIAAELFAFGDRHVLGVWIGRAPVEDFAYALIGMLVPTSLWTYLEGRDRVD
jgi:lycopene cyclase domain-containing protein